MRALDQEATSVPLQLSDQEWHLFIWSCKWTEGVDIGGKWKEGKGGVLSSTLPGNTREKQGCLCKFVNGHIPPARPRPACAEWDPTIPAPEF